MIDIITYILAATITLPFVLFFGLLIGLSLFNVRSQKAFKRAADVSTFWFILSVVFSAYILFKQIIILWIIMLIIIIMALYLVMLWRKEQEVQLKKAILKTWRTSFLLFFGLYTISLLFGIFQRI